jgi:drug/metabolite transporter (DMT)-like permease
LESRPSALTAHLSLLVVAVLYGINYFMLKPVFEEGIDSFAVLAMRCFSVSVIFLAVYPLLTRERIRGRKDWTLVIVSALVGVSLNQTFFLWGVSETSRVNSAVLMITSPVFVLLAAWILGGERINLRKSVGIALSFVGAAGLIMASASDGMQISGASLGGDLKITLNAALYGVYLVTVRPLLQKYQTITVMTWVFVVGSIPNVLVGLPSLLNTDLGAMSNTAWWGIGYLVVFATVMAYFLNGWAMRHLPSSAVGAYVYVQPVFVALVSAAAGYGELSWHTIPRILLIFAGVYLVTIPPRKRPVGPDAAS